MEGIIVLNNKLKELRKSKKITQEELAEIIGVERSSIGKYESPTKPITPSPDVLLRIANYFGVSTDYLLGNEENKSNLDEQLSGIEFALYGEIHDLTDDEKQDILSYVKFKKSQRQE